jgi:hypothetical protein
MQRRLGGAFLVLGMAALGAATAAQADDTSAPGCVVRLLRVDERNVPTFRGECVWSVSPAFVSAVLTDSKRLHRTSSMLRASEQLPDGRIVNVQKTGWPFEDRQSTIEVSNEPLPDGGVRRRHRLAEQQAPLADGAVQVRVDEGLWEVVPHPSGSHVVFELTYEPGGNLPTRIVQSMSPRYIARGLDELRRSAEKLARDGGALPGVAAGPAKE